MVGRFAASFVQSEQAISELTKNKVMSCVKSYVDGCFVSQPGVSMHRWYTTVAGSRHEGNIMGLSSSTKTHRNSGFVRGPLLRNGVPFLV